MHLSSAAEELRRNPKGIRFADLSKICDYFLGEPRQQGARHKPPGLPDSVARRPKSEHTKRQRDGQTVPSAPSH